MKTNSLRNQVRGHTRALLPRQQRHMRKMVLQAFICSSPTLSSISGAEMRTVRDSGCPGSCTKDYRDLPRLSICLPKPSFHTPPHPRPTPPQLQFIPHNLTDPLLSVTISSTNPAHLPGFCLGWFLCMVIRRTNRACCCRTCSSVGNSRARASQFLL